jgi:hypothetical protein
MLALKPPTARRAVVDLLSIDFTRLFIIEENSVATSSPFVSTSWVQGSYRNIHHHTGVIRKVETTAWTNGKAKGRSLVVVGAPTRD